MEQQEMDKILAKAEVLIEALPYIQKFNRKIIVVKYGGSAMRAGSGLMPKPATCILNLFLIKPVTYHSGYG